MTIFGYSHIIGDPAMREKIRKYTICSLIALAAMGASFIAGYLWGLTCFYYG